MLTVHATGSRRSTTWRIIATSFGQVQTPGSILLEFPWHNELVDAAECCRYSKGAIPGEYLVYDQVLAARR